jgi:hypothetical protein
MVPGLADVDGKLVNDGPRRSGPNGYADTDGRVVAGIARLGDGRHDGHLADAVLAGDDQGAPRAAYVGARHRG